MENLNVLLEIITELRAENKTLKDKDESRAETMTFWYKKADALEIELKELKESKECLTENLN
jgi:hypothetical protein